MNQHVFLRKNRGINLVIKKREGEPRSCPRSIYISKIVLFSVCSIFKYVHVFCRIIENTEPVFSEEDLQDILVLNESEQRSEEIR